MNGQTQTPEIQWWPAPAKINLFLHITGRRPDGYHLLQTVFQFLDQGDRLAFTVRADGQIRRVSALAGVSETQDLTVRAARLLQQTAKCALGADITVEKRLPIGGGLGGGSSDAATTLVALNQLWGLGLEEDRLAQLGLQLGADVPVFIAGHAAWAEGVGEQLTPIAPAERWYIVLVPRCHVSTRTVFNAADLTRDCHPITIQNFLSGQGVNVCEAVVRQAYPEVAAALDWLSQFGKARMSGTGACVFSSFDTAGQAEVVMARLPAGWQGFVAKGINRSPLLDMA